MRPIVISATLVIIAPLSASLGACDKNLSWSFDSNAEAGPHHNSAPTATASASPSADGNGGGGGQPFAATATSTPDTWKRYELRGIQLGMSRKHLKGIGFTCGERANSRCYKIMDARCKTGVCKLKTDESFGDQWFELNGNKASLDYMTCATTETDAALVYECRLQVSPRQLLTNDSALGKALIGKYGLYVQKDDPQQGDPEGGGRMLWWNPDVGNNGPEINADCNSEIDAMSQKPLEHQCKITVSDDGIQKMERDKQAERDQQKMRANQPTTAPGL
jgi:hypothetical protein